MEEETPKPGLYRELKEELVHLLSNELTSNTYHVESHVHFDTLYHRLYSLGLNAPVEQLPRPGQSVSPAKRFLFHVNAVELTLNKLKYITQVYLSLVAALAKYKSTRGVSAKRSKRVGTEYLPIDIWACGVDNDGSSERADQHALGLERARAVLAEKQCRYQTLEKQISEILSRESGRELVREDSAEMEVEACWKEVRSKVPDRVYRRFVDRKFGSVAQGIKLEFETAFEKTFDASLEARMESALGMFDNAANSRGK